MEIRGKVAYATADEMRALDGAASEEFGLDSPTLMENAGRSTAALAEQLLGGSASGKRIAVLVGKGNNGGDGLVAGRHLHNHGASVSLYLGSSDEFDGLAGRHLAIATKMGIRVKASKSGLGPPTSSSTPSLATG
jgi:ADP-dependent NAD(P)H-hydrate dehydratase / NAD(P)H-hydrate epimerase